MTDELKTYEIEMPDGSVREVRAAYMCLYSNIIVFFSREDAHPESEIVSYSIHHITRWNEKGKYEIGG